MIAIDPPVSLTFLLHPRGRPHMARREARHGDARQMDDVHLDAASLQSPGQPKSVTSRFIGEDDPFDRLARLHGLGPPALQQPLQRIRVRLKLFR